MPLELPFRILIVKTSALGDIIHLFPVVAYLRALYPQAKIDWVVEKPFAALVAAHPDIDRVLCVDTKKWRKGKDLSKMLAFRRELQQVEYDILFDLQGNSKSGLVTFFARAKSKVGFALQSVPETPNILFTSYRYNPPKGQNIRDDYLSIVKQHCPAPQGTIPADEHLTLKAAPEQLKMLDSVLNCPALQGGQKVMVCPGSAWINKQLTRETLCEFLTLLAGKQSVRYLFVWGNEEEKAWAEELHARFSDTSVIVERMPLPLLQNLMARVDRVIAMDSLPLHLAGTAGVPTFSVFGPSSAAKYKPEGKLHIAYQGSCPYGETFDKRCKRLRTCPTGACIRQLPASALLTAYSTNCRGSNEKNG